MPIALDGDSGPKLRRIQCPNHLFAHCSIDYADLPDQMPGKLLVQQELSLFAFFDYRIAAIDGLDDRPIELLELLTVV